MYKLECPGHMPVSMSPTKTKSGGLMCLEPRLTLPPAQIAVSSPEYSTDFRYRPSQSTVDTNRSQRPLFGRCPYPQCLRLSPQMIGRACRIHMGSPFELKRRKACPVRGIPYMLMLRSALLLLIHLSLPEFNAQRPFHLQGSERCRTNTYPKVAG